MAFLASVGDLDPREGPDQRLTPRRLGAWLADLRTRVAPGTAMQMLQHVYLVISAMVPEQDWSWVKRWPSRPTPAEIRAARRPIEPFDPLELLEAAFAECDAADEPAPTPRLARRYRDGVIFMLACHTAVRRRNLAEIIIGQNLLAVGDGYRLVFEGSTTKTGEVIEFRLPPGLCRRLAVYLERHRPVLLAGLPDHGRLWVNIGGAPLAYEALYGLFDRKGRALLKRRINPHLTRHTLATTLLKSDPRAIGTAAAALTHRGSRSVSEVYDRSGREGAQAEWARVVKAYRRRGGQ